MMSTHWALASRSGKSEIALHDHYLPGTVLSIFIHYLIKVSQQFYVLGIITLSFYRGGTRFREGQEFVQIHSRVQLIHQLLALLSIYARWTNLDAF